MDLVRLCGKIVDIYMPFLIEKHKSVHSILLCKCKSEYASSSSGIIALNLKNHFSVKISLHLLCVKWDKNLLASLVRDYMELSKLLKANKQNLYWAHYSFSAFKINNSSPPQTKLNKNPLGENPSR